MKFAVNLLNRQDEDNHRTSQAHCRYTLMHIYTILNDVVFLIVRMLYIENRHLETVKVQKKTAVTAINILIRVLLVYSYVYHK